MRFNYKFENKNGMESYRYERGKIYKIYSKIADLTYYGSTIQTLKRRLICHKSDFKKGRYCKSQDVLKYNDYEIILVELFPCKSRNELLDREGYYQRNFKCINKQIAGRSQKEWNEDNKVYLKEYFKNYKKKYYEKHKEKISENAKIKMTCCCGSVVRKDDKSKHVKTKKHLKYIESQQQPVELV